MQHYKVIVKDDFSVRRGWIWTDWERCFCHRGLFLNVKCEYGANDFEVYLGEMLYIP